MEALRLKHSGKTIGAQSTSENSLEESIPPLTQAVDEKDGWITYDQPMLYIYAGQGPYISRYALMFDIDRVADFLLATSCSFPYRCRKMDSLISQSKNL